jgi:hypothetical protein
MKLPEVPLAGFSFHSNTLQGIQAKANKPVRFPSLLFNESLIPH